MEENTKEEGKEEGKKSFITNKRATREATEQDKNKPVSAYGVVFVNGSKYRRAQRILDFIRGDAIPQKAEEIQRKDHYIRQLKKHDVDPMAEEALPALYELLGGLIRTPAEQEEAERKAEEMRAKGNNKMFV